MADETISAIVNLLREQRGPLVEALRWSTVLLSELERDGRPESFDGEKVKIPVILAPQQGSGMITETGTLNTPKQLSHTKVRVDSGIAHVPVSFSTKAKLAAKGDAQSWIDLVPDKMRMAEEGLRRVINEQMCGSGDALIAAITATNAASVTVAVGVTANWYQLYPERYVDVLVRSNGSVTSAGRKIVTVNEAAGTLTVDTAISTDNTMGLYIEGSYNNAIAGWGQATATSGTFQELDKALTQSWAGTDVSPSAATDPTIGILDKAERISARRSGTTPDFYFGDPAVIDKYEQMLTVQARWAGDAGTLETGWEGIKFRNKVLVREFDAPSSTLFGARKEDVAIYTRDDGPDWDEIDGSMFKRFGRTLVFEAWLVWMLQLGFKRCNSQVKIGNLNQAT